ncbi:YdgA family protein [Nissabacter sp. SGAir0207]|uniref:YdgA family protein n=1 Tax=Nissabacter sp. SGAir0207 TaxID=2126321 RepID=UPI0010CD069C|nr:YdgA family protein [Nissabacter sp. SGAir0207]QCR36140.1 DUF945 domain-containing protein [Nissabacter sp. SGAir0207]
MKKSLIAVSVIVVLGAAWTGASWYTGKQLESHLDEMVAQANSQIKSQFPQAGVRLVHQDFQRHLFSSNAKLVLQADPAAQGEKALGPGEEVVFNETIDHGPFPLAQLKKFNLIPSMASVHSELANTAAVQGLFTMTKGATPASAETRIAYNGDTQTALALAPIDYQNNASRLEFSGATLDADIARDFATAKFDARSDSVALTSRNQFGQLEKMTFSGVTASSDTHKGALQVAIGDQQLVAKQVVVNVEGKDAAALENFRLNSHFGEQGNTLNGRLDYSLDALKVQGADLGAGKLTVTLDKLDAAALKQFSEQYNQQTMQLMQQGDQLDPAAYQAQAAAILGQNLPILLKGSPSITINPLSWKNSAGESTFTLNLNFNEPPAGQPAAQTQDQLIAQLVRNLDATLTIPMPMATELATQIGKMQGYSEADAKKLAAQQVQGLAAMGQMFKLTNVQDNTISTRFHFANNQVDLNGQTMSLQQFAGLFGIFGAPVDAPAPTQVPGVSPLAPLPGMAPVTPAQ